MAKINKTLVIASGYFNPVHKGHIEYLTRSKELGDKLFVIVNNDTQRKMKGSKEFMNEDERKIVIETLKPVDWAVVAIDKDNREVSKSIKLIHELYKDEFQNFIFTNGGDQTEYTIAEGEICRNLGIKMVFGLGDKIQSSSWLLKDKNELHNRK
jgi:D-beta-D-heptose 7-phosphate kinase/D-beta-D-heptose 1-phosphate adenosyltransferase